MSIGPVFVVAQRQRAGTVRRSAATWNELRLSLAVFETEHEQCCMSHGFLPSIHLEDCPGPERKDGISSLLTTLVRKSPALTA
jgi:hypothetical protein